MKYAYSLESLRKSAELLKRQIDGEPVNINPLKEMPKPQMRLYGIYSIYFETEEEIISYCENNKLSVKDSFVIDYLGNVAERNDVIRKTWKDGKSILYTAVDEYGYGMYNYKRSIYCGKFIWEYNYGSIKQMYQPFRDRGIIFEDDVYGKISESDRKTLQMVKEKHLFNY